MADNFSQEQVQSIFGEFVPVVDETVAPSDENVQSIFGEFMFTLDEAAGVTTTTAGMISTVGGMTTKFSRGVYYRYPGQQLLNWRHAKAVVVAGTNRLLLINPLEYDGEL